MLDIKDITNTIIQGDCLEMMKQMPDNCVDLVLTDPPYGIGVDKTMHKQGGSQYGKAAAPKAHYKNTQWDNIRPTQDYFDTIRRISSNQIIFGGNYFADLLPASSCWLVWDKDNGDNQFADCELCWTSFDKAVRKFRFMWNGMIQENMGRQKEKRVHPTQKPVELVCDILTKYTEQGQLVLDCYSGSGSISVACEKMGRNYIGIEISPEYCEIARKRVQEAKDSMGLFKDLK